jgi:hypothetical protein
MDKETRIWETLVVLVVLGLSVTAWLVSGSFPKGDNPMVGPAVFPRILGAILLISSFGVLWQSWRGAAVANLAAPFDWTKILRPIGVLALFGLAPLGIAQVGLLATTTLITVAVCLLLNAKWLETVLAGVFMLAFVYVVFIWLLKVQA